MNGLGVLGFEPRTSALSELRSSQLSYTPAAARRHFFTLPPLDRVSTSRPTQRPVPCTRYAGRYAWDERTAVLIPPVPRVFWGGRAQSPSENSEDHMVDPYASCPCGSGKKFRFCCQAIYPAIERAFSQFRGGQQEAALRTIDAAAVGNILARGD